MGQFKTYFFMVALLFVSLQPCQAKEDASITTPTADDTTEVAPVADESTSWTTSKLPEFIIRPIGVAGSLFGLGIFIAGSPISGLASIPEPHDAFKITFDDFVKKPFDFTFRRPLGEW